MLVIRLQRVGKKHRASFRIVLQDRRWKPGGKALELLGFYDPHTKEKKFQPERIAHWLKEGAQPSATVHNMFVDADIIKGEKVRAWKPKKPKKGETAPVKIGEAEPAQAEKAEPVAAEAVETPAAA